MLYFFWFDHRLNCGEERLIQWHSTFSSFENETFSFTKTFRDLRMKFFLCFWFEQDSYFFISRTLLCGLSVFIFFNDISFSLTQSNFYVCGKYLLPFDNPVMHFEEKYVFSSRIKICIKSFSRNVCNLYQHCNHWPKIIYILNCQGVIVFVLY